MRRLGEMGQKLVQPQKLVAFAHPLAVAVHEDKDRASLPLSIEARTMSERRMASSTPTAVRSAIPMTSARPPDRNEPDPDSTPLSFLTSWPFGNSEARMSSSVTADPPDFVGESDELIGGQCRNRLRRSARPRPSRYRRHPDTCRNVATGLQGETARLSTCRCRSLRLNQVAPAQRHESPARCRR